MFIAKQGSNLPSAYCTRYGPLKKVEKIYIALFKGRIREDLEEIEVNLEIARGALGEKGPLLPGKKKL